MIVDLVHKSHSVCSLKHHFVLSIKIEKMLLKIRNSGSPESKNPSL